MADATTTAPDELPPRRFSEFLAEHRDGNLATTLPASFMGKPAPAPTFGGGDR